MSGPASSLARLEQGRAAFARRSWAEAHAALDEADAAAPLEAEDLDRLALAAQLAGHTEVSLAVYERAYNRWLDAAQPLRAARSAFWIGMRALGIGEVGRATGWLSRAQRLVDEQTEVSVERGFLLMPLALRLQRAGKDAEVQEIAMRMAAIGDRLGSADLAVFGRNLQGRSLLRLGQVEAGLALLDESMVGLTSSPVSPIIAGLVYCGMIAACQRVFALDRAREWTRALTAWCEEQQGLVAFHGNCLVHRAQMLQLGGDWPEALAQARHAAAVARRVDHGAVGDAHYQEGEIHRLRGDFATAEAAFELASQHGREPQPGLSLLRLAQGRKDAARAAIARVIAETSEVAVRARHLPAAVEIFLACGEPIAARAACRSLDEVATSLGTEALVARAAQARGLLLLAEGDAAGALGPLRRSFWSWQRLDAPYEAACARVQIARACEALGDADGARLERRAARVLFEELGAAADLAGLVALESAASSPPPSSVEDTSTAPQSPAATREPPGRAEKTPGGLSVREVEVLRLVAAGKTNKQIARDLFLSEKTVDRHLSNILAKLDVPSRAAATAFAYQHGLI